MDINSFEDFERRGHSQRRNPLTVLEGGMSASKPPSQGKGSSREPRLRALAEAEPAPVMGLRQIGMADLQGDAVAYSSIPHIEGLNREIVALLQEDGRMPFSSIARELGVSEGTVRSRVGQMHKANLIHFITVVNPLALGYTAWSMLGIKVARGASAHEVASHFRDRPEVVYVMRVAARFDLLAEVVCGSPDELRDFLDAHCYGSDDIAQVEPMMGLGLYKSLFKWEKPLASGKAAGRNSR